MKQETKNTILVASAVSVALGLGAVATDTPKEIQDTAIRAAGVGAIVLGATVGSMITKKGENEDD